VVSGFLTLFVYIRQRLVVIGRRFEDLLILLTEFSSKVKFSLSVAEFVFFQRRLSHSSHSFGHLDRYMYRSGNKVVK
jgi:hypothetical protein